MSETNSIRHKSLTRRFLEHAMDIEAELRKFEHFMNRQHVLLRLDVNRRFYDEASSHHKAGIDADNAELLQQLEDLEQQ